MTQSLVIGMFVAELLAAELPVAGLPVAELPVVRLPVAELLVAGVPVAELPVAGLPVAELPVAGLPVSDWFVAVTLVTGLAATGWTDVVLPVAEQLAVDCAVVEKPVVDNSVPDQLSSVVLYYLGSCKGRPMELSLHSGQQPGFVFDLAVALVF